MTNPLSSSDRNRIIYEQMIARAWEDNAYKARLLANPRQTLTEAGVVLPASGAFVVLENTDTVMHVVLPENTSITDYKDQIASCLADAFPLSASQRIAIHQDTENVK